MFSIDDLNFELVSSPETIDSSSFLVGERYFKPTGPYESLFFATLNGELGKSNDALFDNLLPIPYLDVDSLDDGLFYLRASAYRIEVLAVGAAHDGF